MMSTSPNPDASVFASIMELHFKELDLILEQLLFNKEQMLPILQKCFSLTFLKEGLAEQIAVHKSDSAHRINPGPLDSALLKDFVAQVLAASNKRFIKIVHCYLLEAGKEKQAEEYLQKVSPASRVQHLDSIKMWNYLTLPFQVFKHHLRFFPLRHWAGGLARLWPTDEAGIVPETEDSTSTAVEPNPVGLVLHVGEVTDRSMMDAAAEDKKKKGVMEVKSLLRD
ncbi:PREDICTED: PRUPE_2G180800 [Prunus dulcis]|uniref:PREDICTED: PRUPE_2G180800 n=1 Tax=Prunus dulcis TaxID=3755 RepID=A0A5E4FAT9_PRUDU|nr:PREDICTED: PRUPE_2G180800 [Prunus dulcis]